MDRLAIEFADQAHFLFVYVREAHPDTHPEFPAHRSLEQKFRHVRAMQSRHNTPRTILVDTLDGNVHRQYGGLPNMSWILDHAGLVAYKAAWTAANDIRANLEEVLRFRELKRSGSTTLFYKETISVNPRVTSTAGSRTVEELAARRVQGSIPSNHSGTGR